MSKVYDIEIFTNGIMSGDIPPGRRWLMLVRLHKKDDLAVFVVGDDYTDVWRRATAIGERWQAQWDADQANREKRIDSARVARVKRAAKLAAAEATP